MSLSSIKLHSEEPVKDAHRSIGVNRDDDHPEPSQGHQ